MSHYKTIKRVESLGVFSINFPLLFFISLSVEPYNILPRKLSFITGQTLKSFKELSSFVLPFHRESVCKGKAVFSTHQIFPKFFFEKIFARTAEAISRSLVCLQDKILFTVPAVLRMSSLLAFSLESGCKGTHFFLSRKYTCIFFTRTVLYVKKLSPLGWLN